VINRATVSGLGDEDLLLFFRTLGRFYSGAIVLITYFTVSAALMASAVYYLKDNYDFPTVFDFISKVCHVSIRFT